MTEEDLYNRLAQNMKKFRKQKKITQFTLAEKVDVSEMTIKKIETGQQWPSGNTLSKIATVLGVDFYELFMPVSASYEIPETINKEIQKALKKGYADFVKGCLGRV